MLIFTLHQCLVSNTVVASNILHVGARTAPRIGPPLRGGCVFVRTDGLRWGTWRWARLDLETMRVQTVRSSGLCPGPRGPSAAPPSWLRSSRGSWRSVPRPDSQTLRLPDSQTLRLPDSQTPRLSDSETPRLPDSQTPRLSDSQILGLPDSQTPRLPDSQTPRLSDSQTLRF
jgi:hypothetical protein